MRSSILQRSPNSKCSVRRKTRDIDIATELNDTEIRKRINDCVRVKDRINWIFRILWSADSKERRIMLAHPHARKFISSFCSTFLSHPQTHTHARTHTHTHVHTQSTQARTAVEGKQNTSTSWHCGDLVAFPVFCCLVWPGVGSGEWDVLVIKEFLLELPSRD